MIGKKINQLATELAPVSTDLTIIGDPISGVSKKITLAQLGAIFSGAVSFYTNLAAFPAVGDINVIYCAKDTQKLYLWSGSAYTEVFPSQALLDTYQLRSEKGVSNGYASLDSGGKVPISQLPSSIMEYKGTWNASTNTPTLANGTGDTGDVYICNVAGTVNFGAGPLTFAVGDYVIYSGTIWQRSSGAVGTVTSVAVSRSGDALAITGSPVTTSGTINIGFAGNSTQYINGAGNLVTFPGVINEAQNLITEVYNKTGATLTKGTVVYINGGQGNLPTITKALATGDSTSAQTYGIVRNDITNNNNGYVVVAGRISDLDTQAFTEGTQLYLSSTTAGAYTSTKQYAPNHLVYVGIVVRAHPTQGVIEVKIQNGYEMDELHNVAAQTPTNNDGLFWESATSLWKNKSIATILGYTPQAQLNGTGFVKASGTTISYDNSTYVTTDTFQTISASKTFGVGFSIASAGGTNQISVFQNTSSLFSGSGGTNIFGFNSANNIYFGKGLDNGGVLQWNNSASRYYTLPDATGTIALVGGAGVGTVTSVGLSSATSGVTIGSTPITTSGTITLAIATASGSQQGLLSSTDWTTFNSKQNALTNPVTGTGTTNYLPKFTGASTIGNSQIFDNGTNILIGKTTSTGGLVQISNGTNMYNFDYDASGPYFTTVNNANTVYKRFTLDASELYFNISASTKMRLDASGNLGLGVTPSALWRSTDRVIQLQKGAIIKSQTDANLIDIGSNFYINTSNQFIYLESDFASRYVQYLSQHQWYTAPSGTAGNAISFTQAMTLNASGNLSIGNTNDTFKLDVTGEGRFYQSATSSTAYLRVENNRSRNAAVRLTTILGDYYLGVGIGADVNQFQIFDGNAGATRFTIASTGAATFSATTGNSLTSVSSDFYASLTLQHTGGSNAGQWNIQSVSGAQIGATAGAAFGIYSNTASAYRLYINPSGNVGIGTTSPSYKLDVVGDARVSSLRTESSLTSVTAINTSTFFYMRYNTNGLDAYTNTNEGAPILFSTGGSERMRITSGGFMGIGTTTIDQMLQVAGNISLGRFNLGTSRWIGITNGGGGFGDSSGANIEFTYPTSTTNGMNFYTYNGTTYSAKLQIAASGLATFSGDVKVKTLEITNVGTESTSSGLSTYMEIIVNGQNYLIPLHGMP